MIEPSTRPSIHPFIHPSIYYCINRSINQQTKNKHAINDLINQTTNQSIKEAINQSMNQLNQTQSSPSQYDLIYSNPIQSMKSTNHLIHQQNDGWSNKSVNHTIKGSIHQPSQTTNQACNDSICQSIYEQINS